MQAFKNPTHAPGALLLKGSPGTGKTMCAVNIAKTIGGKFISAGINTLKKGYIGQSAEAVAAVWRLLSTQFRNVQHRADRQSLSDEPYESLL
jgi:ATP-dependent 26S proteasome regulatory subunit